MNTTQLIERLQTLKDKIGDVPIYTLPHALGGEDFTASVICKGKVWTYKCTFCPRLPIQLYTVCFPCFSLEQIYDMILLDYAIAQWNLEDLVIYKDTQEMLDYSGLTLTELTTRLKALAICGPKHTADDGSSLDPDWVLYEERLV